MAQNDTESALTLPIIYYAFQGNEFDNIAAECGCSSNGLREASEIAIRTRHLEASVADEGLGLRPDILKLSLDYPRAVCIHYSIEPDAVFIRGYTWEIEGEPKDARDGGHFYSHFRVPGSHDEDVAFRKSKEDSRALAKPCIYVVSLSDYNAGRILGRWINANQTTEQLYDSVRTILAESKEPPAEDWAIHDCEGFGSVEVSDFADLTDIAAAAAGIVEHGPVFAGLLSHFGGLSGIEEACKYMADGYRGVFQNLAEYVEQLLEDCYGDVLKPLPGFVRYHIDHDGIADDMLMGGDVFVIQIGHEVHVFDANL